MSTPVNVDWKPALLVHGVETYVANPVNGLKFSQVIGKADSLSFQLNGEDPVLDLLIELETDLTLWSNPAGNAPAAKLVFRGRMVALDDAMADNYLVTVTAVAYDQLFQTRFLPTGADYYDVDQATIVWDLVQKAQAQLSGDYGITAGTFASSQPREVHVLPGEYLGKRFDDLSDNLNGYDWWIDPLLRLQVRSPRRVRATDFVFTYPNGNVKALTRKSVASQFRNVDREAGDPTTTPYIGTRLPDARGRYEVSNARTDVSVQQSLIDTAEGNLERSSVPRATWQATLAPGVWGDKLVTEPGDLVRLVANRGRINVDRWVRITEQTFTVTQSGETVVSMALQEE